jgi:C4-dicarboxylate transporter DctM subunit
MDQNTATVIAIAALVGLLALKVPVAFSLTGAGMIGIVLLDGFDGAGTTASSIVFSSTAAYSLSLIPMFILMGLFISHSGLLSGIFDVAQRLTRRLPGGLGLATVGASAFLGGISGSSVADAATLGRVSIHEMSRRGYDRSFAAATVAATSTVAILIPPSIVLVIYGTLTRESIGALLLAGIIPGILTILAYASIVVIYGLRHRETPLSDGPGAVPVATVAATTDRRTQVFGVVSGLLIFAIIVGGIYEGIVTATEALLLASAYTMTGRESGRLARTGSTLVAALREGGALTAMIFALLVGAAVFSHFLVLANVPRSITTWVLGLDVSPSLVVVILLVALIPMGMIIDGLSMLLIMAPLAYPVITELGFDGIWFGILMVKLIEIGLLTPPVGLNVFTVAGLFPDLNSESIFVKVLPYVLADIVVCAAIFAIPDLVTWLPSIASPTS